MYHRPRDAVGVAELALTTTNTSPADAPFMKFGRLKSCEPLAVNCIAGRPLTAFPTTVGSLATTICSALFPPPLRSPQRLTLPPEVACTPLSAISQSLIPVSGRPVPLAGVAAVAMLL